jgi:hypothetical protein
MDESTIVPCRPGYDSQLWWMAESAARRLASERRVQLAPVIQAIEAWAETLPGAL